MMNSVCVICPVHRADDVRVYQRQVRSMLDSNWAVSMHAGQNADGALQHPHLNVTVHAWNGSRFRRLLNLPRIFWRALRERADVYLLHNPDSLPIGFLLKLCRRRVIYDSHEDFSKRLATRDWIPAMLRKPLGRLTTAMERLAVGVFDAVIFTQQGQVDRYNGRPVLIRNLPVVGGAVVADAHRHAGNIDDASASRLIYIGAVHPSRGLDEMLDLVGQLNRSAAARLWLIGTMSDSVAEQGRAHEAWRYVDYIDPLPQSEAFAYVLRSDVGLILLEDVADYSQTSPNKLYEYMMLGIPFLATGFPKWRQELESANAGVFVDSNEPAEILSLAHGLLESPERRAKMGSNGQEFIHDQWNWSMESEKFLSLIDSVADRGARSS